jgi:hypothetical protein
MRCVAELIFKETDKRAYLRDKQACSAAGKEMRR